MVAIRSEDGTVEYRYPQDLERVYEEDTIYSNINPKTLAYKASKMDKIRGVPQGTTSKTQAQIDTIIHELIHRGFYKVDSLKDTPHEGHHAYIDEKQKSYLNPIAEPSRSVRKYYETLVDSDPKASEYIKTHMPELYFKKSQGYFDKEATKPIGIMTKLLRYLMK